MSRESALLIRGGSNYAYEQINSELKEFLIQKMGIRYLEITNTCCPLGDLCKESPDIYMCCLGCLWGIALSQSLHKQGHKSCGFPMEVSGPPQKSYIRAWTGR